MSSRHNVVLCLALFVAPLLCSGTYPSDPPALAPSPPLSLDGTWLLSCPSSNQAIPAQVPGDIITDLQVDTSLPILAPSAYRLPA